MLQVLRIRNFAIIDHLELEFKSGFNVITGETGAGKSIILDAVALILGARANTDIVRAGANEAVVEAIFDVAGNDGVIAKLRSKGIEPEDGELLVKRTVQKNGKNRIFLNEELVTLAQLADFAENLVDLCSQHEHQSLAKSPYQMDLLDKFGGLWEPRRQVREIFSAYKSKARELAELTDGDDHSKMEDFLRFQLQELEAFAARENEEEGLVLERKRLFSATQLIDACGFATEALSESNDDGDAKTLIQKAIKRLAKASETDASLAPIVDVLERAAVEIDEAVSQLHTYVNNINSDPERLDEVEERLAKWSQIKKKYGATYAEIMANHQRIERDLANITNRSDRIEELKSELADIKKAYKSAAKKLSEKRRAVAKTLTKSIQAELDELRMSGTTFEVLFEDRTGEESAWAADGIDKVEFLFAPNEGEGLKPLGKIASGGELSRVMLAIRRVISDRGGIGVYLFDEIDAGIGGQTASVVGKKLKSVSKFNQIICITHLPQIASFATAHFHVSKRVTAGRTFSEIRALKESERIEEIARMLGGIDLSEKTRATAKAMIKEASV